MLARVMKCARAVPRLALGVLLFFAGESLLAQERARSRAVLFPPTGNFQNPGARALGLGGAFVALADDASAVGLNPAGLTQLRRPEISVEYRRLETVLPVNYEGAEFIGPFACTNFGPSLGHCENAFRSEQDSLAFVSLIVPFGRKVTLALYRHELDRERLFLVRPSLDTEEFGQIPGAFEDLDRRIVRTGIAFAYALSEKLSAGVTFNLNSMTQAFRVIEFGTDSETPAFPALLYTFQDSNIEEQRAGATGGVLWRPGRLLSLGAFYSSPVRFEEKGLLHYCADFDPVTEFPICGFEEGAPDFRNRYQRVDFASSFTLPSRLGISVAVRPNSWLALIAEGDRVSYSDNDSDRERINDEGDLVGFDRFAAKDVWELHGGAEVVLALSRAALIAVRGGYWRDPEHSFRYRGCRSRPGEMCDPIRAFSQTNPATGDLDHYAGGIGIAWAWGQLDLGYDWIRQNRAGILSASLVVRAK